MKREINLKGLLSALLIAALMFGAGYALAATHHIAPLVGGGIGGGLSLLLMLIPRSGHMSNGINAGEFQLSGISQEIWSGRIEENLFNDNEFLLASVDDSENVDYKTVHIPNSGATPTVVKNRSKGGAAEDTNLRTDTEVTYNIDEYTTDPFLITNAEEVELSYSKVDSVLYDQQMEINETVAGNMLISWAPTGTALLPDGVTTNANILRSSGIPNNDPDAAKTYAPAYLLGATGNRYTYGIYDVRQAKNFGDKQKWSKKGRHMLLSTDAYDQLVTDMIATKYRDNVTIFNLETGELKKLMGFEIHTRASVVSYTNAGTPVVKAYGAAGAAADNDAVLFWQEGALSRAVGEIHVYDTPNSAVHYGDVYSALVRAGGAKRRTSEVGVGAIVQAAAPDGV